MNQVARKFIKFGIVGFTGVIFDFGVTILLKEVLRINPYLANSIGFICAASNNWLLNRIWTFKDKNPQILKQYIVFMVVSIIGLGLNNFIVWFFTEKVLINFYFSKLVAVGVVMFWNFLVNSKYTFAQPPLAK